jgi:hypothetical protein
MYEYGATEQIKAKGESDHIPAVESPRSLNSDHKFYRQINCFYSPETNGTTYTGVKLGCQRMYFIVISRMPMIEHMLASSLHYGTKLCKIHPFSGVKTTEFCAP